MGRTIASNALTIFVVLLIGAASALVWAQSQYRQAGPLAEAICLHVPGGSSMATVSADLEEQGAVSSGLIFRLGADYSERSSRLKAGSFLVEPGATMEEIVTAITASGRSTCGTEVNYRIGVLRAEVVVRELDPASQTFNETARFRPAEEAAPAKYQAVADAVGTRFRVTLAEGATSWQVVEALKRADFLTGEVAEVPGEGSLAPDSYEVRKGSARAELLTDMQEAQTSILTELWQSRQDGLPLETPEEALVLASIVEKETGQAEERGLVSSVFVNRLNQGMRLQTDPTVIYGITEGRGALGRGLRQSELRRATPYNTYVIEGLPPGPIANPGRDAIAAALNPEDSRYLFFVADGTGGHAFAETLAQHNENVAKWRQIEAERANQ